MRAERKGYPKPDALAGISKGMTLNGNPDAVREGLRELF